MASSTGMSVASRLPVRPTSRFGAPSLAPVAVPVRRSGMAAKRFPAPLRAEKKTGVSAPKLEDLISDLTEKWDEVEDKSTFTVVAAGIVAALWVVSSVVGAVNTLPLFPKFLELIGLLYTAWFVYRYLLFKSSREELISDIDELKKKISGDS